MALDVYFRDDILNALLAAEHTTLAALRVAPTGDSEFAQGYEAGCQSMLHAIALSFGLVQLADMDGARELLPSAGARGIGLGKRLPATAARS